MVASKIDVANPEKLKKLKQWATRKKLKLYSISAVTGEGIEKLKYAMAEEVEKVRRALARAEETRNLEIQRLSSNRAAGLRPAWTGEAPVPTQAGDGLGRPSRARICTALDPTSQPVLIELAPSILAADFAHLADQVEMATAGGASVIHVDVMDGHFVPNLTLGPPVVKSLHPAIWLRWTAI